MKKIIIWIIFSFLLVGIAWADVLMPWGERPNYNQVCISLCMIVTWEPSAACKYSCVSWHVEYIDIMIGIPMIPQLILFFSIFYFLLNNFFWKHLKKKYQRVLLFSVFSIILAMSLIISLQLLYIYNNQPPDFSFSDNLHWKNSINIWGKNLI